MEKKKKGWSTGLPSFGKDGNEVMKDKKTPIEPTPNTKSMVVNYSK